MSCELADRGCGGLSAGGDWCLLGRCACRLALSESDLFVTLGDNVLCSPPPTDSDLLPKLSDRPLLESSSQCWNGENMRDYLSFESCWSSLVEPSLSLVVHTPIVEMATV